MNCNDLPPLVVHDFLAANGLVPPMKNRIQIKVRVKLFANMPTPQAVFKLGEGHLVLSPP